MLHGSFSASAPQVAKSERQNLSPEFLRRLLADPAKLARSTCAETQQASESLDVLFARMVKDVVDCADRPPLDRCLALMCLFRFNIMGSDAGLASSRALGCSSGVAGSALAQAWPTTVALSCEAEAHALCSTGGKCAPASAMFMALAAVCGEAPPMRVTTALFRLAAGPEPSTAHTIPCTTGTCSVPPDMYGVGATVLSDVLAVNISGRNVEGGRTAEANARVPGGALDVCGALRALLPTLPVTSIAGLVENGASVHQCKIETFCLAMQGLVLALLCPDTATLATAGGTSHALRPLLPLLCRQLRDALDSAPLGSYHDHAISSLCGFALHVLQLASTSEVLLAASSGGQAAGSKSTLAAPLLQHILAEARLPECVLLPYLRERSTFWGQQHDNDCTSSTPTLTASVAKALSALAQLAFSAPAATRGRWQRASRSPRLLLLRELSRSARSGSWHGCNVQNTGSSEDSESDTETDASCAHLSLFSQLLFATVNMSQMRAANHGSTTNAKSETEEAADAGASPNDGDAEMRVVQRTGKLFAILPGKAQRQLLFALERGRDVPLLRGSDVFVSLIQTLTDAYLGLCESDSDCEDDIIDGKINDTEVDESKPVQISQNGHAKSTRPNVTNRVKMAATPNAAGGAKAESKTEADADADGAPTSHSMAAEPQCKAEAKLGQSQANPTSKSESSSLLGDLPALDRCSAASRRRNHRRRRQQRRSSSVDVGIEVPTTFLCAINGHMMQYPVRAPSGLVFERSTIEHWLSLHGSICPLTHEPLSLSDLEPDTEMQLQIVEWTSRRDRRDESESDSVTRRRKGSSEDFGTDASDWDIYDFT